MRNEAIHKTMYWFNGIIYKIFFSKHSRQLKGLKDKEKNRTVLIVANGPSLKKVNFDRLSHLPSIGMNKIYLLFKDTRWRPSFIIAANPLVIKQSASHFNHSEIKYLIGLKSLKSLTFVKGALYFFQRRERFISTCFDKEVGAGGTITFAAMQLAVHLGANKILLVGLDHRYSETTTARNKAVTHRHVGDDINHFDPNYFKDQKWDLPNLDVNRESYVLFKNFCDTNSIEIIDLTIDGALDVFEKGELDDYYV